MNLILGWILYFLDDNPVERENIRKFPEVFVPDWSIDPTMFSIKLNSLRCFDQSSITIEDKERTKTYIENKQRENVKEKLINKDTWLKELNTNVEVNKLNKENCKRIFQLFNKTNQFNLSTRRLSEEEIKKYYSKESNNLITIDVSDKFGKLGLVGLIGLNKTKENYLLVIDMILSCRAMGRGIEETMMYLISKEVKENFAKGFLINYKKSNRNYPILKFLNSAKLDSINDFKYKSTSLDNYPKPSSLKIIYKKS